jgi:hypothetical protein
MPEPLRAPTAHLSANRIHSTVRRYAARKAGRRRLDARGEIASTADPTERDSVTPRQGRMVPNNTSRGAISMTRRHREGVRACHGPFVQTSVIQCAGPMPDPPGAAGQPVTGIRGRRDPPGAAGQPGPSVHVRDDRLRTARTAEGSCRRMISAVWSSSNW